jgi:uncharacterized protein (TIGR02246 family)
MYTIFPETTDADDVAAMAARVAELQATQRAEDADGFLALFHPRAIWVNGAGTRLMGRDAIADFTRQVLPGGMAGRSVVYELEHIEFLTPDLASTSVRQQYLDTEGAPLVPASQGSPTYLWERSEEGPWLIRGGQNTGVWNDKTDGDTA